MADINLRGGTLTAGGISVPGLSATSDQIATSYRTGAWYATPCSGQGQMSWASQQGTLTACPIDVGRTVTATALAVNVTAAGAAGSVARLGIFADAGDKAGPGSLLVDAGTVATDTTGHREVTLSQTLVAGRYWLASLFEGAAPGTVYTVASPTTPLGTWLATPHVARPSGYQKAGVAPGSLPSTWPAGQLIAVTSAPMVCVKVTV